MAGAVSIAAWLITLIAVARVEQATSPSSADLAEPSAKPGFRKALGEVWRDREARDFAVFVFLSMLACSAQDLILEPFAGAIFEFTPRASTTLLSVQHGGVLTGMVLVGVISTTIGRKGMATLRLWTIGGCFASAGALAILAFAAHAAPVWPLGPCVFLPGLANGVFAVAAIGSMMALAGRGREQREGVRMGVWGAAQAIAFGLGGFLGAAAVDMIRNVTGDAASAYGAVFAAEAALFVIAAIYAFRVGRIERTPVFTAIGEDMLPSGTAHR